MKEPTVQTQDGPVQGLIKTSSESYKYYAFLGIPYAKPPVGDLRFKDPEPLEKWAGVWQATKYGEKCLQFNPMVRSYEGSEDCLYLNIYTKSIGNERKPVMVWIHGGGFTFGSGDDTHFGPDYLLRKDIVLVSFNFRSGIFGFLDLEDEIAPGNQGFKDQVMLLQWVQSNISNFGGDPSNVTIFGESSGAMSVHYLALSQMAKGLFHKTICQSHTGFSTLARIRNPRRFAFQACEILNDFPLDNQECYEILRSADPQELVRAAEEVRIRTEQKHLRLVFGPGIDDKSTNPFMPVAIEEAALEGVSLPMMLGYNSREGICYLIDHTVFIEHSKRSYENANCNFALMLCSEIVKPVLDRYDLTLNDVRRMYYKNEKISSSNTEIFAKLSTDIHFIEALHRTAKVQVQTKSFPPYFYVFSYDKEVSLMKGTLNSPIPGACHFDEIEYLFYNNRRIQLGLKPFEKGSVRYRIMEQMTEMWTNFATYGTPTPEISELLPVRWLQVDDGTNIRYLNIDEELTMETMENIERRFLAFKSDKK